MVPSFSTLAEAHSAINSWKGGLQPSTTTLGHRHMHRQSSHENLRRKTRPHNTRNEAQGSPSSRRRLGSQVTIAIVAVIVVLVLFSVTGFEGNGYRAIDVNVDASAIQAPADPAPHRTKARYRRLYSPLKFALLRPSATGGAMSPLGDYATTKEPFKSVVKDRKPREPKPITTVKAHIPKEM